MGNAAHDRYLEERVLSADPVELVRMLYQGCGAAVEDARGHLAAGDIAARSRSISRACDFVLELNASLDHERGGELSRHLARLYDYLLRRLMEANLKASDQYLADVQRVLSTLAEGWQGVAQPDPGEQREWKEPVREAEPEPAPWLQPEPSPWAQPPGGLESAYVSQAWSL
jgi:flagellar secretion chaperone FliS